MPALRKQLLDALLEVPAASGPTRADAISAATRVFDQITTDAGRADEAAQHGSLSLRIGLGWAKSHSFYTGQCPVMRYNRGLMMAILHDRAQIAKAVNATPITLDAAPRGYQEFDEGAARKYVLDPNGLIGARS